MVVDVASKFKAKEKYKLADGTVVPGVTTITGQGLGWKTEQLCKWHNKMGLDGIDTQKYVNELADIGTLAHKMIENEVSGKTTDTSDFSKNQIDKAENSALSFWEWYRKNDIKIEFVEKRLVSEVYRFGGTIDIKAKKNGVSAIVDLKSGGIYQDHFIQVGGGYVILAEENLYKSEQVIILNIPRSEDENFFEMILNNKQIEECRYIFLNCLNTYQRKKRLPIIPKFLKKEI